MAQVPVRTATVEPAGSQSMVLMAGNRKLDRTRTEKALGQDGKTFAEALKNAAGGKSRVEKGEFRIRTQKPGKIAPEADAPGKLKARHGSLKKTHQQAFSGKLPRDSGSENLLSSALAAGRSVNVFAAAQIAASVALENQDSKAESGKRDTGSQNLKGVHSDSVRAGSVSSIWKEADPSLGTGSLTSSARRIEVIDLKRTAHSPKSEFRDRMPTRKEAVRSESGVNRGQSAETGKSDSRFAVVETEIGVPRSSSGSGESRSAAAELSKRLDAQAGNEIVRQVKVILTRADAGEIRINLRPENLGRVRVEIHLEDNRLTGRIFVESAAARDAFRNSLEGLQTRLVESGFGAADLELAWDENSGAFGGHGDSAPQNGKDTRFAVREFENMTSSAIREGSTDGLVNMVV